MFLKSLKWKGKVFLLESSLHVECIFYVAYNFFPSNWSRVAWKLHSFSLMLFRAFSHSSSSTLRGTKKKWVVQRLKNNLRSVFFQLATKKTVNLHCVILYRTFSSAESLFIFSNCSPHVSCELKVIVDL